MAARCATAKGSPATPAEGEGELRQLRPSELRFTHDRISATFRSGDLLDRVIDDIRAGRMRFEDFPPLEVTTHDGKNWSISNRRLFVSRVLEHFGVLALITVRLLPFDSERIQHERDGASKFERALSTRNGGAKVRVHSRYHSCQSGSRAPPGAPRPAAGTATAGAAARRPKEGGAGARPTLFTLGYSGRSLGGILELLRQHRVAGLLDVRDNPWSRRPEFERQRLGDWCEENSIAYWWVGNDVGGKSTRDVQARVCTREGQATLDDIRYQLDGDVRWAVLCLEKTWQECAPRCMLQEEMQKRSVNVVHLGPECRCAVPADTPARRQEGAGAPEAPPAAPPAALAVAGAEAPPPPPPGGAGRPARRWAARADAR